jgi:hypothetical protein
MAVKVRVLGFVSPAKPGAQPVRPGKRRGNK